MTSGDDDNQPPKLCAIEGNLPEDNLPQIISLTLMSFMRNKTFLGSSEVDFKEYCT